MKATRHIIAIFLFGILTLPLTSFYSLPAKVYRHKPTSVASNPLVAHKIGRRSDFTGPHNTANRWIVAPGEYFNFLVDNNNHRGLVMVDIPFHPSGLPDSVINAAGGAHGGCFLLSDGEVMCMGDNSSGEIGDGTTTDRTNPVRVNVDSLGNKFNHVIKVLQGGTAANNPWSSSALKDDGTVWIWGSTAFGLRGNGTNSLNSEAHRPVQVIFPGGVFIVDIAISFFGIALDSNGNVWTWGASDVNYNKVLLARGPTPNALTPLQITLPSGRTAKQIAGGGSLQNFVLLDNGSLIGWTYGTSRYLGTVANTDMTTTNYQPWLCDSMITNKLPSPIDSIVVNSQYSYVLLQNGQTFGWGDNVMGCAGNGKEANFYNYHGTNGYKYFDWDQSASPIQYQQLLTQVCPGANNITKIFSGVVLSWYTFLENSGDSLIVFGRGKGGILGNGWSGVDSIAQDLKSAYPNSWDNPDPTIIFPLAIPFMKYSTCPKFLDTATGTALQATYPVNTSGVHPVANAGTTQTVSASFTMLKGTNTYTTPARGIILRKWTQVSGPNTALVPFYANDSAVASGLTTGTYVFKYFIKDNNFKVDSATVSINVLPSNVITIPAGVMGFPGGPHGRVVLH